MTPYLIGIYAHVVAAVVLSGYALFWVVMAFTLRSDDSGLDPHRTLALIGSSRWPPVGALPRGLRIPILGLGWLLVAFMAASGLVLLRLRGIGAPQLASAVFWTHRPGAVIAAKIGLLVLFAGAHTRVALRPTPRAALTAALLVVAIVCASALLV